MNLTEEETISIAAFAARAKQVGWTGTLDLKRDWDSGYLEVVYWRNGRLSAQWFIDTDGNTLNDKDEPIGWGPCGLEGLRWWVASWDEASR